MRGILQDSLSADDVCSDSLYKISGKDYLDFYLCAAIVCFSLGYLYYNIIWVGLLLLCFTPVFEGRYREYLVEKQKKTVLEGFKDALYTISACIASGRQLPEALKEAYLQAEMFGGKDGIISSELKKICDSYQNSNSGLEDLLEDFARRSQLEEISIFASACRICIRNGGDLEKVCLKCSNLLIDRINFNNEAEAILAEKKLDLVILIAMPPIILFFLNISSYEYIEILYTSLPGRIIMSLSLFLMAAAVAWSLKIMNLRL